MIARKRKNDLRGRNESSYDHSREEKRVEVVMGLLVYINLGVIIKFFSQGLLNFDAKISGRQFNELKGFNSR